jgi:uncharacterized protein
MATITEFKEKLSDDIINSIATYHALEGDDLYELIEDIVYHNNIEAFKALIDTGVDVNMDNKYGWTLLHITIRRDRREMVEYLLEKGADINKVDGVGWTPLMESIMDEMTELCGYLVEKGADTTIANQRGATAPMLVQKFGRQSMMGFFS